MVSLIWGSSANIAEYYNLSLSKILADPVFSPPALTFRLNWILIRELIVLCGCCKQISHLTLIRKLVRISQLRSCWSLHFLTFNIWKHLKSNDLRKQCLNTIHFYKKFSIISVWRLKKKRKKEKGRQKLRRRTLIRNWSNYATYIWEWLTFKVQSANISYPWKTKNPEGLGLYFISIDL